MWFNGFTATKSPGVVDVVEVLLAWTRRQMHYRCVPSNEPVGSLRGRGGWEEKRWWEEEGGGLSRGSKNTLQSSFTSTTSSQVQLAGKMLSAGAAVVM